MWRRPAARAVAVLRERRSVAVILDRRRNAEALAHVIAEDDAGEGDVHRVDRLASPLVDRRREADADGADVVADELLDSGVDLLHESVLVRGIGRVDDAPLDDAVLADDPGKQLRARRGRARSHGGKPWAPATILAPVAPKDKPYRVYRGGRVKGPIRPESPKTKPDKKNGPEPRDYRGPKPARSRRRWVRPVLWTLIGVIVVALVWALLGYLAFRSGVKEANKKLDPRAERALTPQDGIDALEPEQHPRPRRRHGPEEPPGLGRALGLDHHRPHRPRRAPHRAPLDPTRPPRRHPGARRGQDQRRLRLSAALRWRSKPCKASPASPSTMSSSSTSRHLRPGDRRSRRRQRGRAQADPLQQVRMPVRHRSALRPLEGLALQEGRADDGRSHARSSTRGSARTSSIRRSRTSRGASGSRPSSRRSRTRSSSFKGSCGRRSSATTS